MASQINITGRNAMLDNLGTLCVYMALYTDIGGTNEVSGGTYARQSITWASASNGVKAISNQPVFSVPGGTTVRSVGFLTALTSGTQHAIDDVTAETFAGDGTYTVASATISLT